MRAGDEPAQLGGRALGAALDRRLGPLALRRVDADEPHGLARAAVDADLERVAVDDAEHTRPARPRRRAGRRARPRLSHAAPLPSASRCSGSPACASSARCAAAWSRKSAQSRSAHRVARAAARDGERRGRR